MRGAKPEPEVTGNDGRFIFEGVKKGKYNLSAERLGFARQSYQQRSIATNLSTGIVTGEEQKTENLVFGMIPGGVITGAVVDTQGNAIVGMRVLALRVVGFAEQRNVQTFLLGAITDDRGNYGISGMPGGSFVLAFTGWTTQSSEVPSATPTAYPMTYFPGTTVAARGGLVHVDPGRETRADMVLSAVPAVPLTGKVALPELKEEETILELSAEGPFGSELGIVQIPIIRARFSVPGVPEGHYLLKLSDNRNRLVGRHAIDVGSSATSVTIGETPFARVTGKVEMHGTPRFPGTPTVVHLSSISTQRQQAVDDAGSAAIGALAPGQYKVSVTKGPPLALLSMTVKGAKQSDGIVTIPDTGEVELSLVADSSVAQNAKGMTLRGDKPEGGLLAALVPANNWENTVAYRFDQSDSDGSFTWIAVPPGDYLAFAFEDGEPPDYASANVIRGLAAKGQKVTITGDPKQNVAVHVTPR